MARANKKVKLNTSSTPDTGRVSFLEIFDFAKEEETKVFSTRFSTDHFSWIDYGVISDAVVENITEMVNQTVYDDYYWSMGMKAISIGDGKNSFSGKWAPND